MLRHLWVIACAAQFTGCGGDSKKPPPKKPVVEEKEPPPKEETAEDRAAQREAAANKVVSKDSTCLPLALKEDGAPRLELAAVGKDAVLCVNDNDGDRLLGVLGCWTVALDTGELTFRSREPVPHRGFAVKLDGKCAHDTFCLPKDSKVPEDRKALIAANGDGTKFAMLVGDDMHIYDGEKQHEAAWGIRQDKGIPSDPVRIHWVGERIFVEGKDGVWVYKAADGTAVGPIEPLGVRDPEPLAPSAGAFLVLDKSRVAISEHGFSTVTTYEADTGKRAKLVRKLPKSPCKKAETEAYWKGEEVGAKCKDFMTKTFAHLSGADAVAGAKNLLVLLRGPRLGELAVLDAKTLAEKKSIKVGWCDAASGGDGEAKPEKKKPAKKGDDDDDEDDDDDDEGDE